MPTDWIDLSLSTTIDALTMSKKAKTIHTQRTALHDLASVSGFSNSKKGKFYPLKIPFSSLFLLS